jgi:hypothetical protein
LKNYQYEVTFALYMLTPTEKFIFSTFLFLLPSSHDQSTNVAPADFIVLTIVSLFVTAAYVYLPDHVAQIYGHVHYYFTADVSMIKEYIPSASSILQGNGGPATGALNVVYEAASTAGLDEL